ncbi:MAG: Wzz/FepE/Etk N-terminal domain-containing protein [Pseudomonadota bacterium]
MNQAMQFEYEDDAMTLHDYIAVVSRRKWPMLLTAVVVAAVTLLAALFWPATYTSQATILIEEQDLPREFVTHTISTYAAQQIQTISQRVMTAESIANISDKFGLFRDPSTNRRPPSTQIAEDFRELMQLNLVSADVIDPRSGRPQEATIAFTISFDDANPRTAQQVTNELVTLFLQENARNRTERVENTEAFLAAQVDALGQRLVDLESSIAEFKDENGSALPELYQYNLSSLERRSSELSEVNRRIRELNTRKLELGAQITLRSPVDGLSASDGSALLSNSDQILALRTELSQKSTLYKETHPDIKALKRQLAELEAAKTINPNISTSGTATSPAYLLLETQLAAADAELEGFQAKRLELFDRINYFESLLSKSPSVERDYNNLRRDYETTQLRYQDVKNKLSEAEIAGSMEQERKGERFTLVEPPNLPVEPTSPNRPAFVLFGLILSIGSAIGLSLLTEAFDKSVHAEKELTKIVGMPPFAVVGYITNSEEVKSAKKLRNLFFGALFLATITFVTLFHLLIMPLDVLWFKLIG